MIQIHALFKNIEDDTHFDKLGELGEALAGHCWVRLFPSAKDKAKFNNSPIHELASYSWCLEDIDKAETVRKHDWSSTLFNRKIIDKEDSVEEGFFEKHYSKICKYETYRKVGICNIIKVHAFTSRSPTEGR